MDEFLFFPFSEREGWVKAHEITAGERYSWAEGLCWGDSTLSSKHWQTETLKEEHLFIYFSFSYKYSVLTYGLPWQCSKLQVVGGVETQKRSLSPPPTHTHAGSHCPAESLGSTWKHQEPRHLWVTGFPRENRVCTLAISRVETHCLPTSKP